MPFCTIISETLCRRSLAEQAQKVVLEREVEAGLARVALPTGAAAQLVVDAPRLVALGADDAQPPSTRTA